MAKAEMSPAILAEGVVRRYRTAGRELTVLDGVDLTVGTGEFIAVVGPSGSGKTTLLALLAGLDRVTQGRIVVEGRDLGALTEDERAEFRLRRMGLVFQTFHLLPTLTALENVLVPLELLGRDGTHRRRWGRQLLERVGLGSRMDHLPGELSGGEQQRVGLARAFAGEPAILLADEPTGNLDRETGREVAELLQELNREMGTTLVLVTHDLELASRAERTVRLRAGVLDRNGGGSG